MVSPATFAGNRRGFTLIEMLIVLGIFSILAMASFPLYSNIQVQSARQSAVEDVADALRLSTSYARQYAEPYGVLFEMHAVTVFKGETYSLRDPLYDRYISFGETIVLSQSFAENQFVVPSSGAVTTGTVSVTDTITDKQATLTMTSLGIVLYE